MDIVILALEGCLASGVTGLADMFWLAEQAVAKSPSLYPNEQRRPQIEAIAWRIQTASVDGQPVRDARGRRMPVDACVLEIERCDAIVIPGLVLDQQGRLPGHATVGALGAWLKKQHGKGAIVCGACAGVLLIGESGLLNGRRCTTTWWLRDELKNRYPKADFIWGACLQDHERVVTAGGPLSWIDVALHLIGTFSGADAARIAADFTVVDNTPMSQKLYAPKGFQTVRDPLLLEAERRVRNASGTLTIAELASSLAISERTLHRRLKSLAGESPKKFITRVKLESARVMLEGMTDSIKRIAHKSGYEDEGSFRRAFFKFSGMNPSAYRVWIKQRATSSSTEQRVDSVA